MKNALSLVALAAGLSQVAATGFGFHNAPKFTCPDNTDNKCILDQDRGFDWSDLPFGGFDSYKGFKWSGFTCSEKFGKRDLLTGRSFQSKCITGKATKEKNNSPKISCDKDQGVQKTSIKKFQVSPEFDCDLEFHYTLPDGSSCKHRSACKASGTVVENTQCGGATDVTIVYPEQPNKPKKTCDFGIHHIDFDCNPPKPTKSYPVISASTSSPATSSSSAAILSSTSSVPAQSSSSSVPGQSSSSSVPAQSSSSSVPAQSSSSSVPAQSSSSSVPAQSSSSVPAQSSSSSVPAQSSSSVPAQSSSSSVPAQSTSSIPAGSTSSSVEIPSSSASVPGVPSYPGQGQSTVSSVGASSTPGSSSSAVETTSSAAGSTSSVAIPGTSSGAIVSSSATEGTSSTAAIPSSSAVVSSFSVTSYLTTSTVFTTSVQTITSCGPEVPDCPAGSTAVTTVTIPISTTICPVTETIGVSTPATQATQSASVPAPAESTTAPIGSSTGVQPIGSSTVPASSTGSGPAPPVETLPCPDVVPSCLNTWLFVVGCKDNTDSACYCPDTTFVKNIFTCLYAHGETDQVISEAISYFQGICAPFVPTNPGIATGAETITTVLTATPTAPPASVTTIEIATTVVVPCTNEVGEEIPSSSSTVTIHTSLTVPGIVFTTVTDSPSATSVVIVPGTYSATVPAATPTLAIPISTPAGGAPPYPIAATSTFSTAPAGTGGAVVPSGTGTNLPIVTAGAAHIGAGMGFLGFAGAIIVAAL
ncbi:hypothetical protein GGS23DRAFT_199925 [Durotheca rogersii]|uniref:uncharacterized protein n=1 Tax=Durotheca rogersii TaxID=419775 RepID=UPI00222113C5|nr:uncharacterized protein GGS23DRAFT_199925 [Durotheca rogersii]KAI5867831.1 hypothetical protein GGS23DRAFT_199925 [Durotheca rogersii]